MKKVNCEKCNREIRKCNYKKHFNSCDGVLKTRFKKLLKCPYCNKDLSNIHGGNHMRWCKLNPNPNNELQENLKNNLQKARNNITEESKKQQGKSLSKAYKEGRATVNWPSFEGKQHSAESKNKIKKGRKKFLLENPEKHPWRKNTKFTSEPCEYLKKLLKENNITFEEEYQPLLPDRFFSIDIAFPDKKIGIEINGNQHYNKNKTLKPYYQNRHNLIEKAGWQLLEIPYKEVYNDNLINKISGFDSLLGVQT